MMKSLLFVLVLAVSSVAANAEDIDLGKFGKLSIDHPASWTLTSRETRDGSRSIKLEPKEGNAQCAILLELMKTPIPIDRERIKAAVLRSCEKPMGGSVEKKSVLKDMNMQQGYGLYCGFRDATLVGKPPVKGDFKTYAIGKCQMTDTVGAIVNVLSDELDGDEAIAMWQMVRSMHVTPAK